MAKKTIAQKEPVKLREKKLSNGNISLYLDIYRNGKRHKEYLKLYLIEAKTPIEREQNRQTLATAQAIKSKRLIEIQNGEYTFTHQFKEDTPFLEYYRNMVKERNTPDTRGNYGNWQSCLRYLELYCDEKTTFRDVTPEFILGFKDFLESVEKDTHKRRGRAENVMCFKVCLKIRKRPISENLAPVSTMLMMKGLLPSIHYAELKGSKMQRSSVII